MSGQILAYALGLLALAGPVQAAGDADGIVTLTKNGPNLLLDGEAKPLKMNISTIGESPRFRCESD
jgi:hypothetical protein